ncbi:MAG: YetF domain-containing protein, partial [Actinomycetes bacterium]
VDNPPILLMAGPEVLEGNLRHARLSRNELYSQLRLAGVQNRDQVRAVVMETTGDVSVLTTGASLDLDLLAGVRGAELLR